MNTSDSPASGREARLAAFWRAADDQRPDDMRAQLDALLAELPAGDARALFERASLHDFLGEEEQAIPVYRAALETGLAGRHRVQAVIQLASTLRNVGDASGAIALLRTVADDEHLGAAARAFLALALFDDDKPAAALRTALETLAPALPAYSRAVSAYAAELGTRPRVRAIVVGVVTFEGHLLAEEYPASERHPGFLRLPGGGIEFGETAREALEREFLEELGAAIDDADALGVTENVFSGHGRRGHEIVHAFRVRSVALEALPIGERLPVLDSDTTVGWYSLDAIRDGGLPLFPPGIVDEGL